MRLGCRGRCSRKKCGLCPKGKVASRPFPGQARSIQWKRSGRKKEEGETPRGRGSSSELHVSPLYAERGLSYCSGSTPIGRGEVVESRGSDCDQMRGSEGRHWLLGVIDNVLLL